MGLYDEVVIDINVSDWIPNFPVPDEELKELWYQTKSLDSLLDVYGINSDNMFVDLGNNFRGNDKLKEKLKEINPDIKPVAKKYILHDESTVTLPFSGSFVFYSSNSQYSFIDFLAVFKNAQLESLHCLTLEERLQ